MQADLASAQFLKVVEEKGYRRLGEVQMHHSDFRLICATNRPLDAAVATEKFRSDLYHRLNIIPIALPALRDMRAEIGPLVQHLLTTIQNCAGIDAEALSALSEHEWSGNVRELRNVLERASLLAQGAVIGREHLRRVERRSTTVLQQPRTSVALENSGGDKNRAACELGISGATLYR